MKFLREYTADNDEETRDRVKTYFDHKAEEKQFKLGEVVLLYDCAKALGNPGSMKRNYYGPFQIVEIRGKTYRLKCMLTEKVKQKFVSGHLIRRCRFPADGDIALMESQL